MQIRDSLNIVSKLTFKRLMNMVGVGASFYWSKVSGKAVHWAAPISISIEPTTACNLGCPECPSGLKQFTRNTGNLKTSFFKDMLKQVADRISYITFYFQGEPYINPDFLDMVSYASSKGVYTATSTNAHFIKPDIAEKTVNSGLDRLIISIDGTTQETYESYRVHGSLEKVLAGTKNIVAAKRKLKSSTPHVIFQFLVVKPNQHQIDDVYKLAKEYGVDEVRLKTAQVYDYEDGNELIPTIEKYARYSQNANGKYEIKNTLDAHCWRLWQSCVVTWDGLVVPCCFDKDATHTMGDLKNESFNQLWVNERYKAFRSSVLKSRKDIDICKNCSEGTKVWG